ncbi:phage Gp37/Gp68 family protein [Cupriavidus basilensis]|uniref:Bacteriophage protein gp37 n=1 Tax=Cupriavidus basilensis TaxID=68895 RepID=A0A0C4YDG8_9BURK|nr:phage Gp37/Gp68 family protein [Cupriavidus basilensis]AJG18781.1 Bacteriophage protein gp37 [Cupriavidus basilensis]
MSESTKIEWTDATFNPWIGCTKVSPACDHCYAEVSTPARTLRVAWGAKENRHRTSPDNWKLPRRWNAQHAEFFAANGRRRRVFCASLADVFDNAVDPAWRADLFKLIEATPNLDWLLLTKRIGNVAAMVPEATDLIDYGEGWQSIWGQGEWPVNVWLGATICNQEEADRDIPKLLAVPACVRFLSMEPLLGPVDISKWLDPWTCSDCGHHGSENDSGPCACADCGVEAKYDRSIGSARCPQCGKDDGTSDDVSDTCPKCESVRGWSRDYGFKFDSERKLLDWVIVGGESGTSARPMHPDWARSLRDQCAAADTPFLFKQWGEWAPPTKREDLRFLGDLMHAGRAIHVYGDGREPDGHFRQGDDHMLRIGKKAAGRLLDGIAHDEYPRDQS